MYGVVGQEKEWWLDTDEQQETITAMSVVDALNELAKDYDVIQFRINSPGGNVFEGEAIVNAIRSCSAEVHTYNDGVAASMAAGIWLAGKKRYMGRNATLMIHAPTSLCWGNAVEMREQANVLDTFTEASAESIAELTDMTVEDVQKAFFEDGKDHWMSYADVERLGFLSTGEDYHVEQRLPGNAQQLSHLQLIQSFAAKPPRQEPQSFFGKVRKWVAPPQTATTSENSEPVTPQELRAAIDAGKITLDQVKQVVEQATPAPTLDPQESLRETIQLAVQAGIEATTGSLTEQIETLQEQVKQLGAAPGAAAAGTYSGADPGSQPANQLEKDAAFFGAVARSGGNPFKNPTAEVPEDFLTQ